MTRLEAFIQGHELKPARIARHARLSRAHLLRLRKGQAEPTRLVMIVIARSCSRLLGYRVKVEDMFNLEGLRKS